MAITKEVNIVVKEKGLDEVNKKVNKLENSLDDLSDAQKNTSDTTQNLSSSVLDNGGAMGLLNDATGGLAMTVKDASEALVLFTKGSKLHTIATNLMTWATNGANIAAKAFKATLLTTGLGAIVVLVSTLVVALSNMKSSAEKAEHAQKLLNDEIERSNSLLSEELSNIDYVTKAQVLRAEAQGKSLKEIKKIEKEGSESRLKAIKEEENRLLSLQKTKGLTVEQSKKINDDLIKNTSAFNKEIQNQELLRLTEEKTNAEKRRTNEQAASDKSKADRIKAKEDALKLDEDAKKALEEKIKSDAQKSYELDQEQKQSIADITEFRNSEIEKREDKEIEAGTNTMARIQGEYDAEKKASDDKIFLDNEVKNAKVDIAMQTLSLISEIAGQGSKVAKAIAITQATISGVQGVQNAFTTASASPVTTVFPAYPFIQAGLAGAFSALQIAKIAKGEKAGSTSAGGGSSSTPSAPSFNLVQGTGSNQIASSINTQQPIEAFVVSKNVSTGQELDRNIIKSASL